MIFREIEPKDNQAVAELVRTNLKAHGLDLPGTVYFDHDLDKLSVFYRGDKAKRFYFIAEENNKVIGGIGLAVFTYFDECAELQKLYLTESAKGRGLGYKLICMIEDKARELGYKRLYLETHTNLQAAIHIYEKCGYREIERPDSVVHSTMNRFFIKEL